MTFLEAMKHLSEGKIIQSNDGSIIRYTRGNFEHSINHYGDDGVSIWARCFDSINSLGSKTWQIYEPKKTKAFELHEAIIVYPEGDFVCGYVSEDYSPRMGAVAKVHFTGKTKTIEVEV